MTVRDKTKEIFEDIISFYGIEEENNLIVPTYKGERFTVKCEGNNYKATFRNEKGAMWSIRKKFSLSLQNYYNKEIDSYDIDYLTRKLQDFMKKNIAFITLKEWREKQ